MDNWKEQLQKYLPTIEQFLTSVLLEETNIDIISDESVEKDQMEGELRDTDIYLYSRDEAHNADIVIILDKEWYGLLSSIMLGVEEKTNNETTRELLKKFATDLSATMLEQVEEDGIEVELADIQVLTLSQMQELYGHREYFWFKMEVEGLADDMVRAELLIGNPEAILEEEAEEEDVAEDGEEAESDKNGDEFSSVDAEEMEKMGSEEEVISGKYIEFAEFDEDATETPNGSSRAMDLLKDVEIDVSVELGRIELPLGKVLQLAKGSVIELEKLAGEPVDILVNGHRIAHGEVVVIDEHFGVRISNLITTKQRLAGIN